MALRIFLTSDLHLGMSFADYPAVQAELVEARFRCLERVVTEAGARRCDLLVIAGDLFHSVSASRSEVRRAAETLRGFAGKLVSVLPGNHDFFSPRDDMWPRFRDACGGAVLFLDETAPRPLVRYNIDACLYPGPCTAKHAGTNAIGWIRAAARDGSIRHHVGVAHGSLEGFSPDFDQRYYPMTPAELLSAGLDLWLLGHTHLRYPQRPGRTERIFCAGTPEPDGFDCAHEGYAWALDIGDDGAVSAEPVRTGGLRFVEERVEVRGPADVARLENRYAGDDAGSVLLRARLSGRAPRELIEEIERARRRMAEKLLHLDLRTGALREEITRERIDREFPEGSFPHSLLARLAEAGDLEALQLAHQLLEESRR